jgi:hypothetical protein
MDGTSKASYVYSHIAVIIAHIFMGLLILYALQRRKVWKFKAKNVIRGVAWLLVIVSALGLIPILLTDYPFTIE